MIVLDRARSVRGVGGPQREGAEVHRPGGAFQFDRFSAPRGRYGIRPFWKAYPSIKVLVADENRHQAVGEGRGFRKSHVIEPPAAASDREPSVFEAREGEVGFAGELAG